MYLYSIPLSISPTLMPHHDFLLFLSLLLLILLLLLVVVVVVRVRLVFVYVWCQCANELFNHCGVGVSTLFFCRHKLQNLLVLSVCSNIYFHYFFFFIQQFTFEQFNGGEIVQIVAFDRCR